MTVNTWHEADALLLLPEALISEMGVQGAKDFLAELLAGARQAQAEMEERAIAACPRCNPRTQEVVASCVT